MKVLLQGAEVFLDEELREVDVVLSESPSGYLIEELAEAGGEPAPHMKVVNLAGKMILPGLADVHVHLREPGFTYKETIATGTAAAARGGFTTVCAMPNLSPPPDNIDELRKQVAAYKKDAVVEVFPYACLTKGGTGTGELLDYAALATEAIGFSDDGFGVETEDLMREIMRRIAAAGGIVAQHTEDLAISGDGYVNDGDYAKKHGHVGKPGKAEWSQLERDLRLVEETGCEYHACHISTIKSIELIRAAKEKGLPVTAETAPHYLAFSDDMLEEHGRFRMNPPIRDAEDMKAVGDALVDGTIDFVATDHAPHADHEKDVPLVDAQNGVVGLEVSVPAVYTHFVTTGRMDIADFVRVMSTAGRERFRLGGGTIEVGKPADLIVFDPHAHGPVEPEHFVSMGQSTPFEGHDLYGRVDATVCTGQVVWDPAALLVPDAVVAPKEKPLD